MTTPSPLELTGPEKAFLKDLAVAAVAAAAEGHPPPDPRQRAVETGLELSRRLLDRRGVFVTLHQDGQLRGCIGYIEGHRPLIDAVVENGRSAAVGDPRFSPVQPPEIPSLDIELSVLTPLVEVSEPEDIAIGRHGILLTMGQKKAVFLPQVATEQGWDLATTLGHLALKAGAAPHAWQEGARFQVFEAEVF